MKRNIILLVDADANTCAATLDAARTGGFEVRFAQIQRDLSELTEFGLDDIAAIVLDYDPDVHGSATSEMLVQWLPPRPLVFISSNEGPWHPPMLAGAPVKHLTKPVTAARLAHAIETLAAGTCHAESPCCDRWGHPCSSPCTRILMRTERDLFPKPAKRHTPAIFEQNLAANHYYARR